MLLTEKELKDIILSQNLLDEKSFQELSEFAQNSNISLTDALIEKNIISDEKLGELIAKSLSIPFIKLANVVIPEEVLKIIPEKIAKKQKIIPFEENDHVKVAMVYPKKKEILDLISQKTGKPIIPYLITERDFFNTLHVYRKDLQKIFDNLMTREKIEAPVAKMVDLIIESAYQDKASDIHIEPEEKRSLVRFRIDGILHDVIVIPKDLHDRIITKIKILSKLRTDEHFSPQDGKIQFHLVEETIDIRVSIIPIADGEKGVLRLLASHYQQLTLRDLGMKDIDLQKSTSAAYKPYGMILSTGPTGSGKTTTIYSILHILNTREKNITTIEDPIEYRIKGVNQIQANPKANLTFASGLRSILRQDPNIIFVGEIRDAETAGIAVNAALTGHLVLSTLHTNDAATALPRLIDMKVEPFLVASTVNIIIAQRLIRKICEVCKTESSISREELIKNLPEEIVTRNLGEAQDFKIYEGAGCKLCHETGYIGRIGLFEVLSVTKEIRKLITEKKDSDVIAKFAQSQGMTTMLDDGLEKVARGITTIEEVLRVTKVESA
ncbi:type II/IV secretion system protein [Candidatus Gottesmanbacteria bacterium]|nr:type II/IV secretion system protein [Candidatus Gottesmanbacteria bacterium]